MLSQLPTHCLKRIGMLKKWLLFFLIFGTCALSFAQSDIFIFNETQNSCHFAFAICSNGKGDSAQNGSLY